MNQLLNLIPILTKGLESVTSIGEILTADDIEEDNGKRILTSMNGDYDFKDVTYRYPDNTDPAVLNLNLHVNAGETVAFVGESGAGKSTILNLLVGFGQPSEGEIFIDGQPLSEISLRSYRKFLDCPQSRQNNRHERRKNDRDRYLRRAAKAKRRLPGDDNGRSRGLKEL